MEDINRLKAQLSKTFGMKNPDTIYTQDVANEERLPHLFSLDRNSTAFILIIMNQAIPFNMVKTIHRFLCQLIILIFVSVVLMIRVQSLHEAQL